MAVSKFLLLSLVVLCGIPPMEASHGEEIAKLRQDKTMLTSRLRYLEETVKALSSRLGVVPKPPPGFKDSTKQKADSLKKEMEKKSKVLLRRLLDLMGRVSPMESRYTVLTNRRRDLEERVKKTTMALDERMKSLSNDTNNLQDSADQKIDSFKKKVGKNITTLFHQLLGIGGVRDLTEQAVGFNAMVLRRTDKLRDGQLIPFNQVGINFRGGFDKLMAHFTAPTPGLYFFTATSSPKQNGHKVSMALMLDDRPVAYSDAYRGDEVYQYQSATLHSVLSLNKGQRVWLASNGDSYIRDDYRTVFSGFLIN